MQSFYLEPEEEFFSIIDKIKQGESSDIVLIVPSGLSVLRSIINLKLLKEEAVSEGKDISIVTSDSLIKKLAQQSGIRILEKENVIEGETKGGLAKEQSPLAKIAKSKRVMSDIVIPIRKIEPEPEPEPEIEEPIIKEQVEEDKFSPPKDFTGEFAGDKEEQFEELFERPPHTKATEGKEEIFYKPPKEKLSFKFFTKKRITVGLIIIGLIVGGFFLYFVLPSAKIIINPKKEAVNFETEVIVDKGADSIIVSDNIIPGQVFQLEMEDSRKFPTTGEKEVEEKAQGKITVYNQYSSSDQALVATTRFLSEDGKLFRLIETTTIPGARVEEGQIIPSSKEIEVEADEAGEDYNIEPSKFTIPGFKGTPKYEGFYGQSTEAITGGAKGRMRVATKDDVDGAIEIVSLELKSKIEKEFSKKIPAELTLLENSQTTETIIASSSLQFDEPGKDFTIRVKIRSWGMAFKEADIIGLIEKNIADKISDNKVLLPSTIKVDYNNIEIDSEKGKAVFSCNVKADTAWNINKDEVKNNLAGKDEVGVRKYLSSLSEIETARVIFWPFWVKEIPKNKEKINIIIDPAP